MTFNVYDKTGKAVIAIVAADSREEALAKVKEFFGDGFTVAETPNA